MKYHYEEDEKVFCRLGKEIKIGDLLAVATDGWSYEEGKMRIGIVVRIRMLRHWTYGAFSDPSKERYFPSITLHNPNWEYNRSYRSVNNMIVLSSHDVEF